MSGPTIEFWRMPGAAELVRHLGRLIAESGQSSEWHTFSLNLRLTPNGTVWVTDESLTPIGGYLGATSGNGALDGRH